MDEARRDACEQALHVLTPDEEWVVAEDAIVHIYEQLGYPVGFMRHLSFATAPMYRWISSHRSLVAGVAFTKRE